MDNIMKLKKIEIDYNDWYLRIHHDGGSVYISKFVKNEETTHTLQDYFVIDTEYVNHLIHGLKAVTGVEEVE